jgi:hypothetical protein
VKRGSFHTKVYLFNDGITDAPKADFTWGLQGIALNELVPIVKRGEYPFMEPLS